MSKRYKLADGSLSTDYEVGDEFIVVDGGIDLCECTKLVRDDGTNCPLFSRRSSGGMHKFWRMVKPTPETKRKAQARKRKFVINRGDYIDGREFTREECERFCELAVECGHPNPYNSGLKYRYAVVDNTDGRVNSVGEEPLPKCGLTNITTQFREFLDKEKGMKEFTKDDLKDGMRVINREGNERVIISGKFYKKEGYDEFSYQGSFDDYGSDLTNNVAHCLDIMRVTDRDGTVLFERKEEPRELTLKEIADAFNVPVERIRIKD